MKKTVFMILVTVVLAASTAFAAKGFPSSLAGFTLGSDIEKYDRYCNPDKAIPVSDAPFLSEALIKGDVLPGVRGGSLSFGNCRNTGKLIRIKLKFYDRGKGFFENMLRKYEKAFGEADTYLGDAFKNVIAWEWVFKNTKGEEISLILMWSRDQEVRPGVSIKMTHESLMRAEFECYKTMDEHRRYEMKGSKIKDLDRYIPR
ncbi:hypothetical protein [Pseudodesulfovibrio sediminis]|uniref:Lipoprotein n=1 Tax=Pseudodesulfovibrio sediminis TaxID=2810563 RepID=A0ABN6EV58_9BACT|nr:hypothetical protein [Pseudodesulfovibrio sediminis]BCS89355.1 hypothetical protein PSDVSF_25970 [Pseudodesulfovibrio sediminis]